MRFLKGEAKGRKACSADVISEPPEVAVAVRELFMEEREHNERLSGLRPYDGNPDVVDDWWTHWAFSRRSGSLNPEPLAAMKTDPIYHATLSPSVLDSLYGAGHPMKFSHPLYHVARSGLARCKIWSAPPLPTSRTVRGRREMRDGRERFRS